MKDCGINYFSAIMDEEDAIRQCLDTAAAFGIKAFIDYDELKNEPETFIKKFKDHPGLGGYFIVDEPVLVLQKSSLMLIKQFVSFDK